MGWEARLRKRGIVTHERQGQTRGAAGRWLVTRGQAAGAVTARDGRAYYYDGAVLRRVHYEGRKAA